MKTILACFFFLFTSLLLVNAATEGLSPESARLVAAQIALAKDPSSKSLQRKYIEAFPATSASFLAVFMPANFGPLYAEANELVPELGRVGEQFPVEVLRKCLLIARSLKWDADGVNYLQQMMLELASKKPNEFSAALASLKNSEQSGALGFLVSGPHRPSPQFEILITKVRESGDISLAARLTTIAKRRKSQEPHGH